MSNHDSNHESNHDAAVRLLDEMPAGRAAALLADCCGSSRWVTAMLSRRPFGTSSALLAAASEVWRSLDGDDWLEAFSHHPRIGERASDRAQGPQGCEWSSAEQAGMNDAARETREALVKTNRAYEQRFGFIYIVCASGRTADELLALAELRMQHDMQYELTVAADEQRCITELRLVKLLESLNTRPQ